MSHGVAGAHGPARARRATLAGMGAGADTASGGAAVAADVATVTGCVDRGVSPGAASARRGKVVRR
jgi:hypothetical protein